MLHVQKVSFSAPFLKLGSIDTGGQTIVNIREPINNWPVQFVYSYLF